MKKELISLFYFLLIGFLLSGLQSSFYFLPIPMPHFWFIILTYCGLKKSLLFNLVANIFQVIVISAFTVTLVSLFLLLLNGISLGLWTFRERFHTNRLQMSLAAGFGSFLFLFLVWTWESLSYGFSFPPILQWTLEAGVTLICAPWLVYILESLDSWVHYERIDTLQNLRV